ncbi:MAG: hypothetical protein ACRDD2_12320 [Sarcina sp.]
MAIFLILIIAMSVRIAFMDSYIQGRRKFIGEESINFLIYTLAVAVYNSQALKSIDGINDYLVLCPMILILILYVTFLYYSYLVIKIKKSRDKKRIFYKNLEYLSIVILLFLLPLIVIYPLIDIGINLIYEFEEKEILEK